MTEPKKVMAELDWTGGLQFSAGKPGGPRVVLDGDGVEGPSPVTTLMCAAGACSGADVVSILEKKRITLTRFRVEVGGRRAGDYPKRLVEVWLRFTLSGDGLTAAAAKHAVDLSVTKYCSVMLSLNPDIPVTTEIVIEP
jgi:putative redox protein